MPEVTITYKKPETLKILKGLAKYFDFKVAAKKEEKKTRSVNGITIIPADKNVDPADLTELFTAKNIDASTLRKEAWQRKK